MQDTVKNTKSAGGVVCNKEGKVLVVSQNNDSWSLPKGHIEEGEDAFAAAQREIYEESGIEDVVLVRELGTYERYKLKKGGGGEDTSELKTITMFLFRTSQEDLHPMDPENPEARWVEQDKVADLLTHPKDKEFFMNILKYLG